MKKEVRTVGTIGIEGSCTSCGKITKVFFIQFGNKERMDSHGWFCYDCRENILNK